MDDVPDSLEIFKELQSDKNFYIFVYEIKDKIVGMATLFIEQKFIHSGSRVGHIEDVVVSSHHRNLGIGRILIEKCVSTAKERNCYKVILDCDEKNQVFYSNLGFVHYGNAMKIAF